MTAAELQEVPQLDRSQFTSTLHLKALRLDASQCQQYMKALQGCGLPCLLNYRQLASFCRCTMI